MELNINFDLVSVQPTSRYVYHMSMFIASYGLVLGTNYLVVFVLLVIIYYKILKRIKRMRIIHEQNHSTHNLYGATEALIIRGQSQARKRVIYFLTVFIISGFFNVLLSYAFTIFEAVQLRNGERVFHDQARTTHLDGGPGFWLYILQSVTVPLQGFLNALVYGWTREDFVYVMAGASLTDTFSEVDQSQDVVTGMEDSGILISTEENEGSLVRIRRDLFPASNTHIELEGSD